MADDDIVVVFDDAAGDGDGGGADTKVTDRSADKDPDLVNDLKSQLTNMRSQNAHLAARAGSAEQVAQQAQEDARKRVNAARADTLDSGIDAEKSKLERAQAEYEAAFEAGDAKAAGKAQREMASASARLVNLEQAKAGLEELPTRRQVRTEQPQPAPAATSSDPFDQWAQGKSAPTVAWAREHKDHVVDPHKFKRVLAAHYDAEAEGIEPDTPEYFRHIEKKIGVGTDRTANGRDEPATTRRPSAPTIPADGGGRGSGGAREVKLTKGERESATDGTLAWNYDDPHGKFKKGDPIGIQEMARRKLAMSEQGLYDKSFTVS